MRGAWPRVWVFSFGVFAFLEGAVGDLAQLGAVVVHGANVPPMDFVRAGLEVVGAEGGEACQHRVDLELGGEEGVEGFGVVGRAGCHLSLSLRHHRRCKDTLRDCACIVKQEMRQDSMKSERAHEMAGITQIVLDRIREILHEKPGITPGQLAEETGLAPNTITKYLRAIREEWQGRG